MQVAVWPVALKLRADDYETSCHVECVRSLRAEQHTRSKSCELIRASIPSSEKFFFSLAFVFVLARNAPLISSARHEMPRMGSVDSEKSNKTFALCQLAPVDTPTPSFFLSYQRPRSRRETFPLFLRPRSSRSFCARQETLSSTSRAVISFNKLHLTRFSGLKIPENCSQ
jgi:hypothetical protein